MTTDNLQALPFISAGAEALFRVTPVIGDATHGKSRMQTGPWMSDERGLPCRGALGVLMDDVTGYPIAARIPAGHWAVTTELHLDFSRNPAVDGSILHAESSVVSSDPDGGLATGRAVDESGRVVAIASARLRFVAAEITTGIADDYVPPVGPSASSIIELLGAHHRPDNAAAGAGTGSRRIALQSARQRPRRYPPVRLRDRRPFGGDTGGGVPDDVDRHGVRAPLPGDRAAHLRSPGDLPWPQLRRRPGRRAQSSRKDLHHSDGHVPSCLVCARNKSGAEPTCPDSTTPSAIRSETLPERLTPVQGFFRQLEAGRVREFRYFSESGHRNCVRNRSSAHPPADTLGGRRRRR